MLFSRISPNCLSSQIKQFKSVNYLIHQHLRTTNLVVRPESLLPISSIYLAPSRKFSSRPNTDSNEWNPVFRFPYIVHARIISRFKLYITWISGINFPVSLILYSTEQIGIPECLISFGITGFSLALLYGFGQLFRRLIGTIYTSPDDRFVRFSHLTFFGNRSETVIELEDIMPLADANLNLNEFLLQVRLNDPVTGHDAGFSKSLFICLKFGGITDPKRFSHIFGDVGNSRN